jgi:hypothetical protein
LRLSSRMMIRPPLVSGMAKKSSQPVIGPVTSSL